MIAFDIDGVIADTTPALKERLVAELGIAGPLPDPTDYDCGSMLPPEHRGRGLQLARQWWAEDPLLYEDAIPIAGARDAVAFLVAAGEFRGFVTRRPRENGIEWATMAWLERHGFPTHVPVRWAGTGSKAVEMRLIGVEVLIDDSPRELEDVFAAGLFGVVFDRPYNRDYEKGIRLYGWRGIATGAVLHRFTLAGWTRPKTEPTPARGAA